MIKVVVIDDEESARAVLVGAINRYFPNKFLVSAMCGSVGGGVEVISKYQLELVFWDIQISGESAQI